jgi:hypothetical protein
MRPLAGQITDMETFHNKGSAKHKCRRQIEKSPLAQIEMSLSTVLDGEHWADDGDCDEPDGDRPDERVTRSGGWQDQDRRGIGVDGTWAASGVSAGEGVRQAWTAGAGVTTAWQAEQPLLSDGFACRSDCIIRERYSDFGPTLAAEKLAELHGIDLARETVRQWMLAAGLWKDRRARLRPVHQPRYRRDCVGELVQIDGSEHWWFEGRGPQCTLLVYIDDATSRLMHLQFVESESTFDYFAATRAYLERHGKPVAFYSDKHGVFRVNKKDAVGGDGMTQFGRALHALNIDIICANSSQAKGRVERANGTLQDRLVKEMRLCGIDTIAAGNAFLPAFIDDLAPRLIRSSSVSGSMSATSSSKATTSLAMASTSRRGSRASPRQAASRSIAGRAKRPGVTHRTMRFSKPRSSSISMMTATPLGRRLRRTSSSGPLSQITRPSTRFGRGMRPSATISSNLVLPTPI